MPEPGDPQALNRYSYVLNNPLRYSDPTGMFEESEIEEYLQTTYPDYWSWYLAVWKSDTVFWAMLRAAKEGYVLRAPSTELTPGTFGSVINGSLTFYGEHQLYEYQGYGPYNLTDNSGNIVNEYDVMFFIEEHPVDLSGLRGESWEQPIYRYYDSSAPIYSGYNRRVTYEQSKWHFDLKAGDSLPFLIGGGATEYVLSSLGVFAACPQCVFIIPFAAVATAGNNSIVMQYALSVAMVDKRTYLQSPNQCYFPPPNEAWDLWK